MSPIRKRENGVTSEQFFKICLTVMAVGFLSFVYVWWPIQAERALKDLKSIQKEISLQKAELNHIHTEYSKLVSLSAIDEWAQQNGQWRSPKPGDVYTITN